MSTVNLNASSSILGMYIANKGLDSSIHGLVLTSISQTLNSLSRMKSKPKISKQNFLSSTLILFFTELNVIQIRSFIFSINYG